MSDKAKVHYFKATGRGNQIRLALAAANIPFEDVYPTGDDDKNKWRAMGGNTTTNIPMLEMPNGGKVYTQSLAVFRVIGRMGNLIPTTDDDDDDDGLYVMDKLIADANDLRTASYKCFIWWGATQAACDEYIDSTLPKHLANFERQLEQSAGEYFIGNTLTLADVACYDAVLNYGSNRVPGGALGDFPTLNAWVGRVEENEGIKKYLASEAFAGLGKFGPSSLGK